MAASSMELFVPAFSELCKVLQNGLKKHFQEAEVTIADCPDLREKPFNLAAQGLCGDTCVVEVGGVPNLLPVVKREKIYDLRNVAKEIDREDCFLIGPGAGPHKVVGVNCELMANVKLGTDEVNNTYIAKVDLEGQCDMKKIGSTEFSLLANLFVSNGQSGKVLKVQAKQRTSKSNFVSAMREILLEHYPNQPIGVGGVFMIQKGKAKLHIMPDFSATPLNGEEDLNNWLKFYDMSAPLICLSVFVSKDPGLDLRLEHTHCFSDHGVGGHYHCDTTPEEVEYLAYLNVGERIYRIDQPETTHQFGRD